MAVVCVYLDELSEARVFPLFVLDELLGLRLQAAELRRLLLKLLPGCIFKLKAAAVTTPTGPKYRV